MKALGVIPARYNSSRFPGKPLADIAGKSMIQRVYEQSLKAQSLSKVVIATDDDRIFSYVQHFTDDVLMTSKNHNNGTERIAESVDILCNSNDYDIVVNIQGDEPFIDPQQIDCAVSILLNNEKADIGTLVVKAAKDEINNPNKVKVVFDANGKALYFSRSVIPYDRDNTNKIDYYIHVGLYVYRIPVLKKIVTFGISKLEETEKLEQLRWLENGINIYVKETMNSSYGIDTPEDIATCLRINNKIKN